MESSSVSICQLQIKDLIPIRSAISELPLKEDGQPYDPSTVVRWALYGLRGVRLTSTKVAGRRYTTKESLRNFLEECAGR
jgi:hypothetical protein